MFQATANQATMSTRQHVSSGTKPACSAIAPPAAPPAKVPRNWTLE
jgi:hypothetical protein